MPVASLHDERRSVRALQAVLVQVAVDPKLTCKRCVATPPNAVVRFSVNSWFHTAAAASSEYKLKHDDNAKAPP